MILFGSFLTLVSSYDVPEQASPNGELGGAWAILQAMQSWAGLVYSNGKLGGAWVILQALKSWAGLVYSNGKLGGAWVILQALKSWAGPGSYCKH